MNQIKKAEALRALHHDPKLLILPNIWDPLGAQLVAGLGFPAVATASAAVAYSLGYDDGQRISFDVMLDVIGRIARSVGPGLIKAGLGAMKRVALALQNYQPYDALSDDAMTTDEILKYVSPHKMP